MKRQVLRRATAYIESWLRYRFDRTNLTGLVVAIAHEGELHFRRSYGYANLERKEPMTVDHIFRIASHSKTFAATAVMQLAEKGSLDIDQPIVKYLPWLKEHKDPRMQLVTPRQLLSHNAGFLRDGSDPNFWELSFPFPDADLFKRDLMKSELVFDNNTRMKYSNFGYTLVGLLIEEVSGMSFHEYCARHILKPLGLEDTGPEFTPEILPRLVTGYSRPDAQKDRLPIDKNINTGAMASATGFYSTAIEMCEYFNNQFVGSHTLLSDESKAEMQHMQVEVPHARNGEKYGLGYQIDYTDFRRLFGHGGGFPGQRTRTLCHEEDKIVVVVLANCVDAEPVAIAKGIFSVIDHFKTSDKNSDPKTIDHLRKFQGRYSHLWGDLDIVEHGTKLIGVDPNSWFPLDADQDYQELDLFDVTKGNGTVMAESYSPGTTDGGNGRARPDLGNVFKITRAFGYYSEGELVKFHFGAGGRVSSVNYAGYYYLPESDYDNAIASKKAKGVGIML
jgi:Beta-lactamase class C and other penicillin binding proteins